ncbi:hypothetical protein RHMOL_Rhmol08G0184400 [Rhododendron molle]|uniref:Uncharacterized protein n=1 Tax=Rhododendron molle TaxID=49168 RepID=A0ACC0MR81_RHOML|nr:hypothetical protein RHMOL_Rhmol08G0184400 [Rhododendron molle]
MSFLPLFFSNKVTFLNKVKRVNFEKLNSFRCNYYIFLKKIGFPKNGQTNWDKGSTICWLWRERNSRVFYNRTQDCSLQRAIIDDVCACISSWSVVKASAQNRDIATSWKISREIFIP